MSGKKPVTAAQVIVAIFALLLVILLLLESLLRILPPPRYNLNWIYDPVLGHRGPRNTLVQLPIQVTTQYNEFGYRGEDPTPRSIRKDYFSVFVLGDSITEAIQLPWRRSFAKRLEYRLNRDLGRDSEVTAFAVSDYGTANELLSYATEAKHQKPDVVFLQFLGLNDFVNNGLGFAGKNKALSDFSRPYLIPRRLEGTVREFHPLGDNLKFTYLRPQWKKWIESVRLLHYLHFFLTTAEWNRKLALLAEQPETDLCASEVEVFLDEPDQRWQDTFEVTERLAVALREQVEKSESGTDGSPPRLIAFYAPSYLEVYDPAWERGLEISMTRCFQKGYSRRNPERRFLEIMKRAGVEAYSLRDDFLKSKLHLQKLYLADGHYSAEGHQLVAEALAKIISRPSPTSNKANTRQH